MKALGLALLLAVAGCTVNNSCLNCENQFVDGGGGGGGDNDGMSGGVDLLPPPPDLNTCDPNHVDSDPMNCGGCGIVCSHNHGIPACVMGNCKVASCDVGFVDLNMDPADDCEYACLYSGTEACDGKDNDCNGQTDELFNTDNDPFNCGMCGNACSFSNGVATCVNKTCTLGGCNTGYKDLDPAKEGCEYKCPVFPPQPFETCNGIDDNCDGQIDEAANLEMPPANLCNTAAGTPCAGTTATCQKRNGVTTWYCNYGADVEFDPSLPNGKVTTEAKCDGKDGNCDGQTDESFNGVGGVCDNGLLGACRDVGQVKCDPADNTKTKCDLTVLPDPVPGSPSTEKCNNQDDDCDGVVDNITGPMRLVRDMVHITTGGLNFYIDRWESSRSDASPGSAGTVDARACSNTGVMPWTRVSFTTAQAACTASGMRMCTAAEWLQACAGAANNVYPYGMSYQGATCNGVDFAATHALAATNAAPMCIGNGVHDLSGNAKEWTNDPQGTTGSPPQTIYVLRGGSYLSPSAGLTCQTTFSQAVSNTALDDIGFRCCSTTAP